jgi:hypothetical protein
VADGLLFELCDERDMHNVAGEKTIDNVSLINSTGSCLVDGMNPRPLLQY